MAINKLTEILTAFSRYDLNRFKKYVQSPFFNENEAIVQLYERIYDRMEVLEENAFVSKEGWQRFVEEVWATLYPRKAYSDQKMRRLVSDLNQLAQDYLAYKVYEGQPLTRLNNMLAALNERHLNKHFASVERLARATRAKLPLRHGDSFLEDYRLEYEKHNFLERNAARHSFEGNHEAADHSLDCYYWSHKLRMYSESLNNRSILNIAVGVNLASALLRAVEGSDLLQVPAVAVYYHIVQTFETAEPEAHFEALLELVQAHATAFPQVELRSIFIFAQNFCIRKINAGALGYYDQLFAIYKALLEHDIIFVNGQLSPSNYKNIVTVALFIKAFDWVEDFIYRYNGRLPRSYQRSALDYNLANLYFHQSAFHKVIEQLQRMEYKDAFDGLSSRWLLLKTYFELRENEAFEALTDSFSAFIRRNKSLSERNKSKYLNAVRFLHRIMKAPYATLKNREALAQQLHTTTIIIDKRWLLHKLEERL